MTDNSSLEMLDDAINNPFARSDRWGERTIPLTHYELGTLNECDRPLKEGEAVYRLAGHGTQNDGSVYPKYQTIGHVKYTDYNVYEIVLCEGFDPSVLNELLYTIEGYTDTDPSSNAPFVRRGDLVEHLCGSDPVKGFVTKLSHVWGGTYQLHVEIIGSDEILIDEVGAFKLLVFGKDILCCEYTSVRYAHYADQA